MSREKFQNLSRKTLHRLKLTVKYEAKEYRMKIPVKIKREKPEQVTCSRTAKAKLIRLRNERRESFIQVVDMLLAAHESQREGK